MPKKLILQCFLSPGDICQLAYLVLSLHKTYPGQYITDVRCSAKAIFEGNPYITPIEDTDPDAQWVTCEYPFINRSNQSVVSFMTGMISHLERVLNIHIDPATLDETIVIRDEEKSWYSAIYEKLGKDVPYWIIDCGWKRDYTTKSYPTEYWKQIVAARPEVTFVQIGLDNPHHVHPRIKAQNVIDMVGKTDDRQMIRLMYNAFGCITPVSFPMVLSACVPANPRFFRKSRPCIVLAGGREGNHYQQLPNQIMLHGCGVYPWSDCGGCWCSRVVPLGDNDPKDKELCKSPVNIKDQWVCQAVADIKPQQVSSLIKRYMDEYKRWADVRSQSKRSVQLNNTNSQLKLVGGTEAVVEQKEAI